MHAAPITLTLVMVGGPDNVPDVSSFRQSISGEVRPGGPQEALVGYYGRTKRIVSGGQTCNTPPC